MKNKHNIQVKVGDQMVISKAAIKRDGVTIDSRTQRDSEIFLSKGCKGFSGPTIPNNCYISFPSALIR